VFVQRGHPDICLSKNFFLDFSHIIVLYLSCQPECILRWKLSIIILLIFIKLCVCVLSLEGKTICMNAHIFKGVHCTKFHSLTSHCHFLRACSLFFRQFAFLLVILKPNGCSFGDIKVSLYFSSSVCSSYDIVCLHPNH
jgi:hypothetical protein